MSKDRYKNLSRFIYHPIHAHIDLNFTLPLFRIKSFDERGGGGELKVVFCKVGLRWRFCFVKGTRICFKKLLSISVNITYTSENKNYSTLSYQNTTYN